jgi:hypothetical protein
MNNDSFVHKNLYEYFHLSNEKREKIIIRIYMIIGRVWAKYQTPLASHL